MIRELLYKILIILYFNCTAIMQAYYWNYRKAL